MPTTPPLDSDLNIASVDPDHFVGTWHRTIIEVWRGPSTVEGAQRMAATCEKMLATFPKDVTFIAVLERSSPPPAESVRKVLAAWSRDVVPRMAVAALVSDGGGFRSALVRGVGVALTVFAPHKVPFKFCASVDEGVEQLAPFLGRSRGGADGLKTAIEQARQQLK